MTQVIRHYGFAQVPRLVLRGEKYKKKLSLAEKGLYACLKDICGESGECYFVLRNLSEEIGTSTSTLSRFIPVLRDKGVISAEKKLRGKGSNKHEVWHIRIVDVWIENDSLYRPVDTVQPDTCSNMKQTSVSNRNNSRSNVHSVSNGNDTVSDRDKDCFNLTDRIITTGNNTLSEEDKVTFLSACADAPSFNFEDEVVAISLEDVIAYQSLERTEADEQLPTSSAQVIHMPQNVQVKNKTRIVNGLQKPAQNITSLFGENQPTEQEPVNEKGKGKGKGGKRKKEQDAPMLTEEEKAQEAIYEERRKSLQKQINERRGGPLRTGRGCVIETESIKTLIREFDDYQIAAIWKHAATENWKYTKCPTKIGGYELLEESRPTWSLIKGRPEHRQYNTTGKAPSENSQQSTGKLIAATPGSQYIVDELQSRYEDNYAAWLASEEGQACMREAEAEEARQAQLAAVGGR